MHLLLTIALALFAMGLLVLVAGLFISSERSTRRRRAWVGGSAIAAGLVVVIALWVAEPAVCTALGGRVVRWTVGPSAGNEGCVHEWGGNGSNDPSFSSEDPWPWT